MVRSSPPIFLVFLAILVVTALINPSTSVSDVEPAAGYQTGALSLGFIEGYNTMDAIAGLAFGIVVIDIIRSMGVTDDSDVAKDVLSSGLLTSIPHDRDLRYHHSHGHPVQRSV